MLSLFFSSPRTIRAIILAAFIIPLSSTSIWAGGLELPDNTARGFARAGASAASVSDPSALWFNPAGLAHARGSQTLLDFRITKLQSRFTRSSFEYDTASKTLQNSDDFPPVTNQENPFVSPFFATSFDFGRDDFTLGFGVFGPSAHGKRNYPVDGANRYMIVSSDVLMAFYTLGAAWKPKKNFSVGLAIQWVDLFRSQFGLMVNMPIAELSGAPVAPTESSQYDVLFEMDVQDRFTPSAVVGLWYQPHPRFEIGFSSRLLPVHLRSSGSFTLTPQGQTMTNILESMLSVTDNSVNLGLNLPAWFRGGFRYRHLDAQGKELFDIEADFVYEMWSVLENFDVSLGQGFSVTFDEDQDPEPIEVAPMQIPKKYKDTYSVRLGSTVHLDEDFELHGGAFYESGASPKTHTNIDFTASERVGVTTGFTYTFGSYALTAAYGHVFQPDQVVSAEETEIYQLHPVSPCTPPYEENCHASNPGKPPGVPAGGGRFESSFHVLSLGLTMSFGEGN